MPRLDGNPSDAHSGHGDNINGSFSLTLDRRGEKKKNFKWIWESRISKTTSFKRNAKTLETTGRGERAHTHTNWEEATTTESGGSSHVSGADIGPGTGDHEEVLFTDDG